MTHTFNTTIEKFLAPKKMAVAGVSRNPKKFGYIAFKELAERGFDLYPVHPEADEILGVKCYHSVASLPDGVTHLLSMVPKPETESVVSEALSRGIGNIWIQQMSETPEAVELAKEKKAGLVIRTCILMHAGPVKGIHWFHRGMLKMFGMLPK